MVPSYVVTAPTPQCLGALARRVAPALFFLVLAGGGVFISDWTDPFGRLFALGGVMVISAFVALSLALSTRTEPRVVVEAPGIRLGPAAVPWTSVRHIVVAPITGTNKIEIGLRLWPGAPLPQGVPAVLFDPARPQATQVRHRLPARRVDARRLLATARALAPPTVAALFEPAAPPDPRPGRRAVGMDPRAAGRGEAVGVVTAVRMRSAGRVFVHAPSTRGPVYRHRFKPHPVVRFDLPDGRQVVTETSAPGSGGPGERVLVTYDAADPTDARALGPAPRARWLPRA
jgi:hypothetical protein